MSTEGTDTETAAVARKPFAWTFTTPLYVGAGLNPVNSSIIATALVPIATELHVAVGSTAVLVSSLYLASAVAQPTAGKLAEVLGARRIFLFGIVLVLLGGVVGGLGKNLAMLTVARVLVGIGTSAAFPCAMVLIRRRAQDAGLDAPPGGVLGGIAIAGMATAAVGPPIGGLLVGAAGWRWAFLINIPVTLAAMVMAVRWLPADPPLDRVDHGFRRVADRIDLPGIVGFAVSMSALVIFLTALPGSSGARSPSSPWPRCPRSGGSCAGPPRSSTSAASPPTARSPAPICARPSPCSARTP